MSARLKIALLGCGRAARYLHLPVLMKLPQVELLAVAEAESERRAEVQASCPAANVFESYEELLSESELDAVVISLPNSLHVPAAAAAFARGLHVYLEKPLATSLAEARSLIPAWQSSGRGGMIGHNYRFGPMQQQARSTIAAGRIGEIIALQTVFSSAGEDLPRWKRQRETGGGALLDLASHHFDLACWLVDSSPVAISCSLRSLNSEEDTVMVQLEFKNGVIAQVMASLCAGENDRFEVYGTKGRLVVDRYRSDRVEMHPKSLDRVRMLRFAHAAKALASPSYWKPKLMEAGPEVSVWRALSEFADSSLENRRPKPDLLDGLRSLALVEAAECASTERRKVVIEPIEAEELPNNESPAG
jgi:predicted dehydrogenase